MLTKMFALYDVKSESYGVPFFFAAVGLAVRALTDLVNDNKSSISRYPDDFILYQLGEFDDSKGILDSCKPIDIGRASSFVNKVRVPLSVPVSERPVVNGVI